MLFHVACIPLFLLLSMSWPTEGRTDPKHKDEIEALPGLSDVITFRQYSGYLDATKNKRLFYWFVESQRDPRRDPVVLWLNGGPGCSSVNGMLTENGPYRVNPDGKTLKLNPYSWNKIANVIFLESPYGVGFSKLDLHDNDIPNDDETCEQNYLALKAFFLKFPEFSRQEFYLTGESYSGIYVPMLAARVADDQSIHFKGMAIGNGLYDNRYDTNSKVYYSYYHGLIGNEMWQKLHGNCCTNVKPGAICDYYTAAKTNSTCNKLVVDVDNRVWSIGLNPYNLYQECAGGVLMQDGVLQLATTTNKKKVFVHPGPQFLNTGWRAKVIKQMLREPVETVLVGTPCTNATATTNYLNERAVRDALHVSEQVTSWEDCSGKVSMTYVKQYSDMKQQFQKVLNKGLRITLYNGDADMACNFLMNEWFVESLKLKERDAYKAWYYTDRSDNSKQVAGFVWQFEQLNFITFKGSGHFVPTDKPEQALTMFSKFLNNESY